jgi:molybdopterin/thiamine biosynthesis adenylyltransferase/rhodanese-related sulfurtransferase
MALDYNDFVAEARRHVAAIAGADLEARLDEIDALIDVREADEFDQGSIPGAYFIPRGMLEGNLTALFPDPATEIILFCSADHRAALAARSLQAMGYENVKYLEGGFVEWKNNGRVWERESRLSGDQRARYSRHILLPEVGELGQARLLESKALIIGAGGLGSPAALYLAAAGVGTIGIVDFDVVDETNLQRQILHNLERIGQAKVESARETLTALNPDVKVIPYNERLTADNILEIMSQFDVVVDGTDNFPTRYLVNDASLHLKIPVVHGSIFRFEGQASVFWPYRGPCYRCLFPEPPPPELAPSCAVAGVLGVLPGIIGSIEAVEAIKVLLGLGDPLVGRLLTYDALDEEFRVLRLHRDDHCPACGDESRPPQLVDYDQYCTPAGSVHRH